MYYLTTTVNKTEMDFEMGTITVSFNDLQTTIKELIQNNPEATSFVFTVVQHKD